MNPTQTKLDALRRAYATLQGVDTKCLPAHDRRAHRATLALLGGAIDLAAELAARLEEGRR